MSKCMLAPLPAGHRNYAAVSPIPGCLRRNRVPDRSPWCRISPQTVSQKARHLQNPRRGWKKLLSFPLARILHPRKLRQPECSDAQSSTAASLMQVLVQSFSHVWVRPLNTWLRDCLCERSEATSSCFLFESRLPVTSLPAPPHK